jgi:hypothetical protein
MEAAAKGDAVEQLKRIPSAIERTRPHADTVGMTRKPEPTKPTTWTIYKIAAKQLQLGTADAPDETAAIEKASRSRPRTRAEDFRRRHEGLHLCKLWRLVSVASA